jgi:hypothetical protein
MPEITNLVFTHKEVVTALIKSQNIHEGIWGLYVEFGISAANIGQGPEDIQPAAIIPILKLGLQQFKNVTNISVDASVVNPDPNEGKLAKENPGVGEG